MADKKPDDLQTIGLNIVEKYKIIEFLSFYGEPHLVGNLAFETTIKPDIDIQIYADKELIKEKAKELGQKLTNLGFLNVTLRELKKSKKFLILSKIEEAGYTWNLDLTFTSPHPSYLQDSYRFYLNNVEKMTPEKREQIKKFKIKFCDKKIFQDNPSYYIYRGVLEDNIQNDEEMERYLNLKRAEMRSPRPASTARRAGSRMEETMIKAVFFDAIDTLFKPYPNKIEMYIRIIKKTTGLDISRDKMTEVWDYIVKDTEEAAAREFSSDGTLAWDGFNRRILELLDYDGDLDKKGQELLYEAWSNPENFILFDDVIKTLDILKKRHLLIGCLSNENKNLNNFFVYFKINSYFDFIITSEETGIEKPNPLIFQIAIKKAKALPQEIIHIGDSLNSDYKGALGAGMMAILIDRENIIRDNEQTVKITKLTNIVNYLEG